MTVEQRLYRAAHDLREIEIDTPPFAAPVRPSAVARLVPAVAAGLLALVGVAGVLAVDATVPAPTVPTAQMADPAPSERSVPSLHEAERSPATLTPREEILIIASLGDVEIEQLNGEFEIPVGVS